MPTFDEMTKYLDQKKLITILKRFLDTKASAPEIAKYFVVKDNMDFYATDYGCMIHLAFTNKWKDKWNFSPGRITYLLPTFIVPPISNSPRLKPLCLAASSPESDSLGL